MGDISKLYGRNLKDKIARDNLGNLTLLKTTNKASVVAAINELVAASQSLLTTANTLTATNNELVGKLTALTARVTALETEEPAEVTINGISATYTGGDVLVGTALTDLTGITVTATYSDGSKVNVTGYTLSGVIVEGSNTIMVAYEGFAAMFTVTGVAELEPESLLILNNRTLATSYSNDWFDDTKYFNPSAYQDGNKPSNSALCGIADLTENSISVTENGSGGTGVSFPVSIYNGSDINRRGKTFKLTWDALAGNTARFRVRVGGVSSPQYVDIAKGNDGKTSATIVVSEDGYTVTVNGTAFTRSGNYISYIVFFFGSSTGTTTSYKNVKLVEVTE